MVATNLEMTHGEDAREDAPSSAEIRLKVKQPRSDPVAGTRSEHRRAARLKCGLNVRLAKQTAHTTHERGDKPPRRFDATLRETCGDKTASPHHRGEKSRHANGATVPSCTSSVIAGCSHGRQARKGVQKTKPKAILRLKELKPWVHCGVRIAACEQVSGRCCAWTPRARPRGPPGWLGHAQHVRT